jgi:16S rRNA (guanine527-N7)-methyltransferase
MNSAAILEEGLEFLKADPAMGQILKDRSTEIVMLLKKYIGEIELFNPAYGLVGTNDHRELVIKHILDSLAPLGILCSLAGPAGKSALHIADAGSGAGLPGIPLAICLPDHSLTLIERMGRRAGFLRNTIAVLGLSNVTVEETEMEKAAPGRFDLITFRAFRPLEPELVKGLFRLCTEGGTLAAYKGRQEKIDEELNIFTNLSYHWDIYPYKVPFLDEERRLVTIKEHL